MPFWPSDYAALRLRKHWLQPFPDDCGQGQDDALAALPVPSQELPQIALSAAAASVSTADGATAGADSAATADAPAGGDTSDPAAPVQAPLPLSEDDRAFLETHLNGELLSDTLVAYTTPSGVYLPLGELSRMLDLAIMVDPPQRKATGWIIERSRTFELDLVAATAATNTRRVKLGSGDALLYRDEIYVRAELVNKLLPVEAKVSATDLTLTLTAREPLPRQSRLAREQRAAQLGQGDDGDAAGMTLPIPYRLATWPSLDLNLSLNGSNRAAAQTRYEARMAGDLLFAGYQFYAGSNDRAELSDVRVLFERKDPSGSGLAGPFHATRSNLGDTYTPSLPIGAQSGSGRGLFSTSEPLEQASIFNRTDLRGELPLGFQVELYVNEILRGSQLDAVDGRYEFKDVPLSFGRNVIRLVFYGPRGERREQVRRLNVGGGQLPAGSFSYAIGAVQQGRNLFEPGRRLAAFDLATGQLRVVGRLSYGLSNATTLQAGLAGFTTPDGRRSWLSTLALRTSIAGVAVNFDGALDNHSGQAVAVGVGGRFGPVSVVLRHSEYRGGFVDEVVPSSASTARPLLRATEVRADAALRIGTFSLPLALDARRIEFASHENTLEANLRSSLPVGRYMLSSSVNLQNSNLASGHMWTASGTTDVSASVASWHLRAGVTYLLAPQARVDSASLTADRAISDRLSFRLAATKTLGQNRGAAFGVGATFRLNNLLITGNANYLTTGHDLRVGLTLSVGALFNPVSRRYQLAPPGAASGSSMVIDAFADSNGDGLRGADEAPVAGLPITSGARQVHTNTHGIAVVTGLGDGTLARIESLPDEIDDPFLKLDHTVVEFVPRAGRVGVAHYAFVQNGETSVHARFVAHDGSSRPLSALTLQLLDENGKVVAAGRTEFDGSLLIEALRPGRYRVVIDPEQADRLGLKLKDPVTLTIVPGVGFADGGDVLVEQTE